MASSSTKTKAVSVAKQGGRTAIIVIRGLVRYVERWFSTMARTLSFVWNSYRRAHVALYARTSGGTANDQTLRILGVFGNVMAHAGLLAVRIVWCFVQAI